MVYVKDVQKKSLFAVYIQKQSRSHFQKKRKKKKRKNCPFPCKACKNNIKAITNYRNWKRNKCISCIDCYCLNKMTHYILRVTFIAIPEFPLAFALWYCLYKLLLYCVTILFYSVITWSIKQINNWCCYCINQLIEENNTKKPTARVYYIKLPISFKQMTVLQKIKFKRRLDSFCKLKE